MPTVRTQVEILRDALERFRMGTYETRGNALHGTHSCPCVTCIAREALAAADAAPLVDEGDEWIPNKMQQTMYFEGGLAPSLNAIRAAIRALNARGKR